MSYPISHKTVLVLDRSAAMAQSCAVRLDMDSLSRSRAPGVIPLASISKSLWSCAVEGSLEYCRIVWDIYPCGKLVRLLVNSDSVHHVNTWSSDEQHLSALMQTLPQVMVDSTPDSVDQRRPAHSLCNGLAAALQCLGELSDAQRASSAADSCQKVMNRGRVLVLCRLQDEPQVQRLHEWFMDALLQHNRTAAAGATIHSCDLTLVSVQPANQELDPVSHRAGSQLSSILSGSVWSCRAGVQLTSCLTSLVLLHYQLASTTVTGIPMKEEQNAGSSANYDVELLHPAVVLAQLLDGNGAETQQLRSRQPGCQYETVTLRWCAPRAGPVELQQCTAAAPVTPVDINSRPSSCLTNFLLNGRAVMLEAARRSGSKQLSHMLSAHGGAIFMHALSSGRSVLEELPSISEGVGGRVIDYRIPEFAQLIRNNRLGPPATGSTAEDAASEQLARHTRYWPLTMSETVVLALPGVEPLHALLVRRTLTAADVVECKKLVYALVGMETRNEPLPATAQSTARGRGLKREEQYRVMWHELETMARLHSRSAEHKQVLECVAECRGRAELPAGAVVDLDQAMAVLDRSCPTVTEAAVALDSPASPPPVKKSRAAPACRQPRNLLSMWTTRVDADNAVKRIEFSGRLAAGQNKFKLYANMAKKDKPDVEVKR